MGIKVALPDIDGIMASKVKEIEDAIVYNLSYVGERCVNEARTGHTYTDRTGNLTSSMGYVLVKDGQIIRESSFEPVHGQYENMQRVQFIVKATGKKVDYSAKGQSGDGQEGARTGKTFARSIASRFPSGIVLIVTAGMNYARYVSDRGFNVLASAEILAEKLVPQLMQRLGYERR